MKMKALGMLIALGLVATQAQAVGPLGSYSCFNKSNISAVYVGDLGDKQDYDVGNLKKLNPEKGCYYGETTAGSSGPIPAKCFVAFVKKASQVNWGKTNNDYTAAQCVFHNNPDKVVTASMQFQSKDIYSNILHKGDFDGSFDKELENNYGVAVCLDKVSNKSFDGYGQYAFCELMSNTRDGSGKRERIATINFQMTPGVSTGAASAASTGDTAVPTNTEDAKSSAGGKLKKKLGF